jgi:hypothetical protein
VGIVDVVRRQWIECIPQESGHGEHFGGHGVGNGKALLLGIAEEVYVSLEMPF